MYKIVALLLILSCTSCMVLPENDHTKKYQCALSTDMKVLKLVNLTDGDTSFYKWNDEMFAIITIPTSAIVSASYVLVNNIYHIGEKQWLLLAIIVKKFLPLNEAGPKKVFY